MIQITNPKKFWLLVLAVVLIVFFVVWKIAWGSAVILKSGDVTIELGTRAGTLWKTIVSEGYSSRVLPWKYYSRVYRADSKLQVGVYHLEKGELVKTVVLRFAQGDVSSQEVAITYPEGFTLNQIASRTVAKNIGTESDFIAQAKAANYADQYSFLAQLPAGRNLEGYLFPDTYHVFPDDNPKDVIDRMLANFNKKITDDILQETKAQGRTLDQIIIMASIIEREVNRSQDLAKVSGVLWKRFDAGAGLGADATIRYALDKWNAPLTVQDLALDSPYNTRKYRGLPPSAIGNPGISAVLAALHPEKADYYYYLSAPDGTTIFSKTIDEHNANKAKYLR